jgi:hypothetical protein
MDPDPDPGDPKTCGSGGSGFGSGSATLFKSLKIPSRSLEICWTLRVDEELILIFYFCVKAIRQEDYPQSTLCQ